MIQLRSSDPLQGAMIRGAVEGTVMGATITIPSIYILNRRWPYFRSLPVQLKVLGAIVVVFPMMSIRAEHRMVDFERSHWDGADKFAAERREHEDRLRWESFTMKEKFADWAARHKLSFIVGSWAVAMTAAGAIIMRDPHLLGSLWALYRPIATYLYDTREVVQARVWAQGLTLGVIIATGALTHSQRAEAAQMRKHGGDHSWMDVLEDQRKVKNGAKQLP